MLLVPSEGYIVRIKKNRVDKIKIKIKIKTHQIIKKNKNTHTKKRIKGLRNLLYLWCQVYFIKVYKFILFYILFYIYNCCEKLILNEFDFTCEY